MPGIFTLKSTHPDPQILTKTPRSKTPNHNFPLVSQPGRRQHRRRCGVPPLPRGAARRRGANRAGCGDVWCGGRARGRRAVLVRAPHFFCHILHLGHTCVASVASSRPCNLAQQLRLPRTPAPAIAPFPSTCDCAAPQQLLPCHSQPVA
eukprot:363375-Chlamydomonas_euryale.AAC.6